MLKTILASLTGFESDETALDTAYLAARLFDAHIECVCARPDPAQIAMRSSPYDYGTALNAAEFFAALEEENELRRKNARLTFHAFCERRNVGVTHTPTGLSGVTAEWREIAGDEVQTTIDQGRYHDLIVLGRAPSASTLSASGAGAVLVSSGRPLLLAPARVPENLGSTIAIAWKDTPEAARALTAAMPFLQGRKTIVLSAEEDSQKQGAVVASAEQLAARLRWHGIGVDVRYVIAGGRALPDAILDDARASGADLFVMGGYGHSRLRELVFGGFTRHVLNGSALPVLLAH